MKIYKGKSRRSNGRYNSKKETNFIVVPFLAFLLIGAYFWPQGTPQTELFRQPDALPHVVQVKAKEIEPTATPRPASRGSKEEIRQMIREAFPEDPVVAVAVGTSESIGLNPNVENRGKANGKYRGECSIGLFQINLASDGCMGKRVHWDKVPGETLEDKIAWLKVPANNIKIARGIYVASGKSWNPWGAYTNGSYKGHLK